MNHCHRPSHSGSAGLLATFRWHHVAVAALVSILGLEVLEAGCIDSVEAAAGSFLFQCSSWLRQASALLQAHLVSAHCAGAGPDKVILDCFLKPALACYGLRSNLRHYWSVETRHVGTQASGASFLWFLRIH